MPDDEITVPGGRSRRDRRLRVLTLVDGIGTFGGGERVARQLATHLDRSRFEAAFCVSRWEEPHDPVHDPSLEELRSAEVEFVGLERSGRFDLRPWRELIGFMRDWQPDVLHTHMFGSNLWGSLISLRAKVPVFVAHEHTWSFEGQPLRKLIDRNLIARRADAFVAVSRLDQRRMVEIERIPQAKTRFIPNGIPLPPAAEPGDDVWAELGIEPGRPVIGAVVVLRPQKALEVLLRASVAIREEIPDVQVLVVGGAEISSADDDNSYVQSLRRLSVDLGLEGTVRFLGLRDDVPALLKAFDVCLLSSDYEGSPLSVLEYMEASRPVVATRVGGVPDIVQDGVTGVLVEPQAPEALASAVVGLLRDPDRAAAMGRAGKERRLREFTIEAAVGRVQALYEELCAARAGA